MGKSHLAVGVASLAGVYGARMLAMAYEGPYSEILHVGIKQAEDFMVPAGVAGIAISVIGLGLYFVGTLLPDIDCETSMLGRYVYIPVQHHTWTHTAWVLALFAVFSLFSPVFVWLFAGYFIHLLCDSPSACGVAWFYPITKYKTYLNGARVKKGHKVKLYHTGKTSEIVFAAILCLLNFAIFGLGLFVFFRT